MSSGRRPATPVLEPRPVRMGHLGIVVRDLDRTVAFYERVVGLRLTERFTYPEEAVGHGVMVAAGAFMRCDSAHHCISIFTLRSEFQPAQTASQPGDALHHMAFEMATPEELVAKLAHVRSCGVAIANERHGGPGNQPRFYIRDPEGNLIEFYWGIDQVGWEGRPRAYLPIEEIDLDSYDFDAFVRAREADAAALSTNGHSVSLVPEAGDEPA